MEIYTDIRQLPVANFFEITKTGNFAFMQKQDFFTSATQLFENDEYLKNAFREIVYQLPDVDCSNERLMAKILLNDLYYQIEPKPEKKKKKALYEHQLKQKFEAVVKIQTTNIDDEIGVLSKFLGFQIDRFKMSLADYLAHRKQFTKSIQYNGN